MKIKSDASSKPRQLRLNTELQKRGFTTTLFWMIVMSFGMVLMLAALISPQITGLVAFVVFFIGLNRVDASIDWFRGIDDKVSISEKDII